MPASSVCPVCHLPGAFEQICPNCGRTTVSAEQEVLSPTLVAAIQARVEKEWRLASQANSQFSLPLQQFAARVLRIVERHIASVTTAETSPGQAVRQLLDNLKWSDLFLTTACAFGDNQAWGSFRRQYRSVIRLAALKASTNASEAAELGDTALTDLFLPQESGRAESKISQYHGLGSLEGWVKVVVHRMAIDQTRLHQRNVPIEELDVEIPSNFANGSADESLKQRESDHAREMVSQCLTVALAQLSTQERLVLNLYYLQDVNLKGIGRLLKAHESTASRLLDRIKTQLQKSVRKQLQEKFNIRKTEVSHVLDLAQQDLGIDLRKILSE